MSRRLYHPKRTYAYSRLNTLRACVPCLSPCPHICQTIVQFSKLPKIEIGGTKGKTLTQTVWEVADEFDQCITAFRNVP